MTKPFKIYVLKLVQGKFYVGRTLKNISTRFDEHMGLGLGLNERIGSQWTRLYKPVDIIDSHISTDKFDEDKWTKKYMELYGIPNVRGGSYSNVNLTWWQIKALENEFACANDLCFICGMKGHFASNCNKKPTHNKN